MLKYIPETTARILEVGCGEGAFCRQLKELDRNFEVWGLEIDSEAAMEASKVCDKIIVGDINEKFNELPENYFDCVFFNDVLEHLYAPGKVIELIKPLLSSHGVLIASIPNFRFIANLIEVVYQGEFQYKKEGGILDDTHIRFFTKKSMKRMFEEHGYNVLIMEGINQRNDWKMKLLSVISLGKMNDARYLQFAVVAKPIYEKL